MGAGEVDVQEDVKDDADALDLELGDAADCREKVRLVLQTQRLREVGLGRTADRTQEAPRTSTNHTPLNICAYTHLSHYAAQSELSPFYTFDSSLSFRV